MLKISEKQKIILMKYNIDSGNYNNIDDLLLEIDDEMTSYVDENDEPLKEFKELEKVYDELYINNK